MPLIRVLLTIDILKVDINLERVYKGNTVVLNVVHHRELGRPAASLGLAKDAFSFIFTTLREFVNCKKTTSRLPI